MRLHIVLELFTTDLLNNEVFSSGVMVLVP